MNVTTQYNTEAKQMERAFANRAQPMHALPPDTMSEIERVNANIVSLNDGLTSNHERRHAANMAAWRELHAEHLAAGRLDIAAEIMTQKIIPNRS